MTYENGSSTDRVHDSQDQPMYIIDDEELAILRAVLSSWLAMTDNPPLPAEEPTEELREAARKLFEELTS